jgi:hypothetical protein
VNLARQRESLRYLNRAKAVLHPCTAAPFSEQVRREKIYVDTIPAAPAVLCDLAVLDDQRSVFGGECHVQAVVPSQRRTPP